MSFCKKAFGSIEAEQVIIATPVSMIRSLFVVLSFSVLISASMNTYANWINPVWIEVGRQYEVNDYILGKRVLFGTKEAARDYTINNLICYEGSVIVDCSFCRWIEENNYVAAWEVTYTNTAGQWTITCGSRHTPVVIEYDQICPDSMYPLAVDSSGNGTVDRCYRKDLGYNQGDNGCQSPDTSQANPINIGLGNKYQIETDYTGNNVYPLTVTRTYNSIAAAWQHFPEMQLDDGVNWAGVVRPDGKLLIFKKQLAGGWSANPDVTGRLEALDDGAGTITGWRYTTLDNQVEEYDSLGKIISVTNRGGLTHTFSYASAEITVTHSDGEKLVYQLDGANRITGFTAPGNQTYGYSYDSSGKLISISYPNGGGTRTYHYENTTFPGALTGITDANGDRYATWTYDSQGRAVSSEHFGGAEKVTLDYTYLNDATDPRTTATNALGKQTTYHFTTLYGVRKVTEVEGHPSPSCAAANKNYTYDTNGFVASKTDWKGNTTTYVRNSKGQELSRTEASGTPQARTITTEWHPIFNLRTKVTEPDREATYIYDASGNLLNRQTVDIGSAP